MSNATLLDDASQLLLTKDLCSRIDSSPLSKRINRLNPAKLKEQRPGSSIAKTRSKQSSKKKIIPELRGAVDVLRTRLASPLEFKSVTRPSTRMQIDCRDTVSPGRYHRQYYSIGGYEFGKSPRLNDTIDHQLSSILYKTTNNELSSNPGEFEMRNINDAKNFNVVNQMLRDKNKNHNNKVRCVMKQSKIRKVREIEGRKNEYNLKIENIRWKQDKETIFRAKRVWARIFVVASWSCVVKNKFVRVKVRNI
jgi:hypothetical protein